MNYEIIEVINNNPNYLLRVVVDANSSTFLNFDHIPSQEEVNLVMEKYLAQLNNNDGVS